MTRPRVATASLAGCFGCHMSLLDLDLEFLELAELVEFSRCPLNDVKRVEEGCALGLIEGGCCTDGNVEVLRRFRSRCEVLVSVGDCATMGGIPAWRNMVPLTECLEEAYRDGPSVVNPGGELPNDPELPLLLDRVRPAHEVVRIDYLLPGCPPAAEAIGRVVRAILDGEEPELPYDLLKYD